MIPPRTAGPERVLFIAWPFVTFVLPAMICWGFGDLEQYFLIPASWIIIPVAGLLGLIPYLIARTRGWRAVPGNSIGLLMLNWWSWFTVVCTIPGKLTGGGLSSVLELLTAGGMSRAWNDRILVVALIVGSVSWAALLLTVAIAGEVREPRRLHRRVGLTAAIAAPCGVLIAGLLGGTVENARTDAAGERPELASARPLDEQLNLLAQREQEMQAAFSEVRGLIASDGWVGVYPWMFRSCEREAHPCYDIYISAELTRTVESTQTEIAHRAQARIADELSAAGWRSTRQPPYCHGDEIESYRNDEGHRLCVEVDEREISVALISPPYWGDLFELRGAADPDALIFNVDAERRSDIYRWDEWPTSDLSPR